MSTRVRLLASLLTGVLALGVVGASLAWACTFGGVVYRVDPNHGPPGAEVEVKGGGFTGKVEIRWESKDGPLLGTTDSVYADEKSTNFAAKVTIPDNARQGEMGVIVATGKAYGPDGSEVDSESKPQAFFVERVETEDPAGESEGSDGSRGSDGSGDSNGSRGSGSSGSVGAPDLGQTPGIAPAPGQPGGTASVRGEPQLLPDGDRISPATTSDRPGLAPTGATRSRNSSGQSLFGGSVPPSGQADGAGARGDAGGRVGAGPSERSAAGDLWSGFGSGGSPSLSSPPVPVAEEGAGSQLWVGAGLLGFGLVALLGGFGVAEARRRRVLTGALDRG